MSAEPLILGAANAPYPPGPSLLWHLLSAKPLWQSPVDTLKINAQRYGDLVHFRALDGHVFQFNHPTLIQEFLTENEKNNRRVHVMQRAKSFLGDGLLTSEEPLHMRQRRMAAPAFHRQRITAYADVISGFAAEVTSRWQPGLRDLHPEMLLIALRIVGKTLFNIDDEAEALEITSAFDSMRGAPPPPAWVPQTFLEAVQKIPFGPMLRIKQGMEKIDAIIYGMIAERRRDPGDRGDLLSMLLEATDTDESTARDHTGHMTDKLIRDECLTIILAGHETTANVLSFAMWLLAEHPEVQDALQEEALRVLGTRRPTAADYPDLKYSYMVFAEVMRLFPTVWVIGRSCGPQPYQFRGFTIPPGATLLAPQIVVHRDPRFWQDPESFNPLRFSEENKNRPRYAYFPFGGGSRQCIGEALAWMEGVFTLTTIAREWRLAKPPGAKKDIPMQASINLRPKKGVPIILERR